MLPYPWRHSCSSWTGWLCQLPIQGKQLNTNKNTYTCILVLWLLFPLLGQAMCHKFILQLWTPLSFFIIYFHCNILHTVYKHTCEIYIIYQLLCYLKFKASYVEKTCSLIDHAPSLWFAIPLNSTCESVNSKRCPAFSITCTIHVNMCSTYYYHAHYIFLQEKRRLK